MSTIFNKIIKREIPAHIIYEDDIVMAFLDINPINKGHTLLIPKEPSTDGLETAPEVMAHLIKVAQKIGRVQREKLGCTGVNFIMNNGEDANQDVFHTHLHIIPRFKDDHRFTSPVHDKYEGGENVAVARILAEGM